jgi:hypothetical protein
MRTKAWLTVALLGVASCANCPCATQNTCAGDGDCETGYVCRDEACVQRGSACILDEECPADRACLNGFCELGVRMVVVDAGQDAGLQCRFNEATCLSPTVLQVCELGRFAQVDCARNGLSCQDGGCQAAACSGDAGTRCLDLATVETCATGVLRDCAQDELCWGGRCASATGEPCALDTECAGGLCHCKGGACDGGALASGYCTLGGCNSDGGACPLTDVCMGLASAGGGRQNLCGQRAAADCPESTAGMPAGYVGPFKRYLPIPDPTNAERYTFGDPVCFDARPGPPGASCAGPTDCIGGSTTGFTGQCLTFAGAVASGYCTHGCDQTHPCAPGNACVNRPGDPAGSGVCMLKCSDQRPGLAQCNRTGLSCRAAGNGYSVLDGRTDALGYCLPN